MLDNFQRDLKKGKIAETIVKDVFSALTTEFTFEDISSDRSFFYCGDIKAVNCKTGKEVFIEVKNDSRIADTRNILCEEEVYYKKYDYVGRGNMSGNSDIFAIVSQSERKIYVIDFKILQKNYRKGEFKVIKHPQQESYVYLLPLNTIDYLGGLIATIDYEYEQLQEVA